MGARYHRDLILDSTDIEISKGTLPMVDAFSAFGSNKEDTGLYKKLKERGVEQVYCVGLAYDYCVGYTAEDSAEEGFETYIVKDATVSVNPEDERAMNQRLRDAGAKIVRMKDLL